MAGNDETILNWQLLMFIILIILVVIFVFADAYQHIQVMEDCKPSAIGLCETKDMLFSRHYIEGDDTVMVECTAQYEVHTYVVNCEGGS